ncbi:MAG: hypothetical protein J5787_05110 [Alphaproteobacteria bacterium]|nr:hypothetical protein [Alphaproteobacteria bacterium]
MKYGITVFSTCSGTKRKLPFFSFYKVLWKIIRIYVSSGCGFQLEASVKTSKHWEVCVNLEIPGFDKEFDFSFSCKKTAPFCLWLYLFGVDLHLYWGDGRHEEYDGHLDKYYDYDALVAEHPDYDYKQIDALIPYSKKLPYRFKEFYCSDRLKVYANDIDNAPNARAVELALPFFRYLKVSYKKPWWGALWLGAEVWSNPSASGIKLSLFKRELKMLIAKNLLKRRSNLMTGNAIDRFFRLRGNADLSDQEIYDAFSKMIYDEYAGNGKYVFSGSTTVRQILENGVNPLSYLKRNPYVFEEASDETVETFYEYLETHPVDDGFWEAIKEKDCDLKPETVERLRKIREKSRDLALPEQKKD